MVRIFNQYVSAKSLLLILLEGLLIAASLLGAARLRFWNNIEEFEIYTAWPDFGLQALIIIVICQLCFYYNELYDLSSQRGAGEQLIRVEQSLGAASVFLGLVYFMAPSLLIGRGIFFIGMVLISTSIMVSRSVLDKAWSIASPQNIAILGSGELAMDVAREVSRRDDLNIRLAGLVAERPAEIPQEDLFGIPILGPATEIAAIVQRAGISRIIVAMEDRRGVLPVRDLVRLRVQGVRVEDAHTAIAALTGRIWLRTVRPSWFVFSDGFHRSRFTEVAKRVIDLSLSALGAVLTAPLMLLITAAVRLDSKGPVIYRQVRVGMRGRHFEVWKFRSMRQDAEAAAGAQWAEENDPRITRVGRILRKFRLDELPQFFNVIRGEMSFVGPRPERPVFVDQLRNQIPYYDERHTVRPGITGWAQVRYHYGSSVEDAFRKLEYDLFYLKNMSVLFDCVIVLQTIRIVLGGRSAR